MPELSYRANVFPIWCKIILFTHFKFELLSYRAMKTIKLSCYLQKFGFSKQTRTRSKNEKTKKRTIFQTKRAENADSMNQLMTKAVISEIELEKFGFVFCSELNL